MTCCWGVVVTAAVAAVAAADYSTDFYDGAWDQPAQAHTSAVPAYVGAGGAVA